MQESLARWPDEVPALQASFVLSAVAAVAQQEQEKSFRRIRLRRRSIAVIVSSCPLAGHCANP